MGRFRADTDATLQEADGDVADRMEREANRFAAELLMPTDVCRQRATSFARITAAARAVSSLTDLQVSCW